MPATSVVDSKLLVRLDLSNALASNLRFGGDLRNLAHLSSQLLLYEQVLIPTHDFGIVPALLSWLGVDLLEDMLKSHALKFVRQARHLGYVGNGNGISTFEIHAGDAPLPWHEEARFALSPRAIELQLANGAVSLTESERDRLSALTLHKSVDIPYDAKSFTNHVVGETYRDILESQSLAAYVRRANKVRPDKAIDLTWLPQVGPAQLRTLGRDGAVNDPIDLVLAIAEINMQIMIAQKEHDADLHAAPGTENLLREKLRRAGVSTTALDGFIQLLELNSLPDIRQPLLAGEVTPAELWTVRQTNRGRRFRQWLREAQTQDARELEKAYVDALAQRNLGDNLPLRVLRFAVTSTAGFLSGPGGIIAGAFDSFFFESWLKGFSPRIFFDDLRHLVPSTEHKSRRRRKWTGRSR